MIKSKKQMLIVIASFTLVLLLLATTYAFFNYTRTGSANNVRTGNIYFNTSEGTTLNLTNMFPMDSTEAANANLDSVTVGIVGNTTYTDGEEFEITLVDVTNTVNGKQVPINYIATYEAANGGTIGSSSDTYFSSRNLKDANIYRLSASGVITNGEQVLAGYIKSGSTGINGTLTIKAYIDANRIAITDTYNGPSATPNDGNGTTNGWVNGRTVFTTTEWNSLNSNSISFKIKAVSQEGIWVEADGTIATCPNCYFMFPSRGYSYGYGGSPIEEITQYNDTYSANYHDIVNATGKNYFLGFTINNGIIDRGFACGIKAENPNKDTPFCIEGTGSTSEMYDMLDSNSEILYSLFGEYPDEPYGCQDYGWNNEKFGVNCLDSFHTGTSIDDYNQGLWASVNYCSADIGEMGCL